MQLRLRFLLSSAGLMLLSQAPVAGAVSLVPMEEPVSTLVSPGTGPFIPSMQYAFSGSSLIATTVTSTPLLCANTSAPMLPGTTLNPVYFSATGSGSGSGQNPARPFVFGASWSSPNVSATAMGATNVAMSPTSMTFSGDALGSLVCYGLDSAGARRITRDVFFDGMDGTYNSAVALSVFHVPSNATDYYGYTIDVTIPPLPANTTCGVSGLDCNFSLIEGTDTSIFSTGAADSASGMSGLWCLAPAGAQSCSTPPPPGGTSPTAGNINVGYANYGVGGLPSLTAPIAPAAAKSFHFVVVRYFHTGTTALPVSGAPVVIAALFSPSDLEENKLDDNVATGNNQVN